MAGIEVLAQELLLEIMFMLPDNIGQKFAIAQISRLWRDVALDSHLFWSSFTGDSKADYRRLPLMLERSGSSTMINIQFRFRYSDFVAWRTDASTVLIPYVPRIETLDMTFSVPVDATALLGSGMEFPVLRTLHLDPGIGPTLLFTAPQLRALDIDAIGLRDWVTLLSPSLESVRLWGGTLEMLVAVLELCPRVSRIAVKTSELSYGNETEARFEALSRPFAPALRELELDVFEDTDLVRVLKTGFSDVVLHTLKGRICNGHGEENVALLAGTLLLGVGPLVDFKLVDLMQDVELQDEAGHVRHLQCWNSYFEVREVWKHLSLHYDLHKTVREIRIHAEHWHDYVEVFESYPPQLEDGITLAIDTSQGKFPQIWDDEGHFQQASKILQMPGLFKVKFCGANDSDYFLQTISDVLALVEPPAGRKVEVCVELETGVQSALTTLRSTLLENSSSWAICSHCVRCVQ
ncbi:hypothetical protein DFH08DRAFT_131539 [Mycena albidolilacea]|uniref:F-box domain-containing protein n=1 Tax=Mycena albidolilacea TaxID=1033008 RepID=A0AAD7A3X3_9AGAR|nr:hypothetical protein DFH08DRAFT_131539 [Mycena albidolilacea]